MKRLLFSAALLASGAVGASGDYGPSYMMFKAYTKPDIPLERFQAGELGVIQPGMRRVYLYAAWRAIALGAKAHSMPGSPNGLARADGSVFGYGWDVAGTDDPNIGGMRSAAAEARGLSADSPAVRAIVACPAPATAFAARTFKGLGARPDAARERVRDWLLAQLQVGQACAAAEEARYRYGRKVGLDVPLPAPLPETEPAYWRQLRQYQRAAAAFHAEHYADSTAIFDQIGATAGHPMRQFGRYLALRSEFRRDLAEDRKADPHTRERLLAALDQRANAIVADASLQPMHESTVALMRSIRARLTPEARLEELSRYLDDPAADPYALDRLGDWSSILDESPLRPDRTRHDFADWILTLRACAESTRPDTSCSLQAAQALERWGATASSPWLVAALMLGTELPPELERAALAVAPDNPGYLTVRYHLARLYRLAGKRDQARAIDDAALALTLSPGTRNLFREERFAVATSVADAAGYLLRLNVDYLPHDAYWQLNDDGLAWVNANLSVGDMLVLARQGALPPAVRARAAAAAFVRAELLADTGHALAAADVLEPLIPSLQRALDDYRHARTAPERRHALLLAALHYGLSAQLDTQPELPAAVSADMAAASNWCKFTDPGAGLWPPSFPWRLPPPPSVGDVKQAKAEMDRLARLKTATGFVGEHALRWAADHPRDPDVPWLLHVAVVSTRGGCVDADAPALSRKAYRLLHSRYADSEWSERTPYFYDFTGGK